MATRGRKKDDGRAKSGTARRGGRKGDGGTKRGASGSAAHVGSKPRASARARGGRSNSSRSSRETPTSHVAIGYTDRQELDRFLEGERGDMVVHGPLHVGSDVEAAATLGTGATDGTPCMVVPLIRERMDEIQREVSDALNRFQGRAGRGRARPRTIRDTGGSARGAGAGAIRLGEGRREIE